MYLSLEYKQTHIHEKSLNLFLCMALVSECEKKKLSSNLPFNYKLNSEQKDINTRETQPIRAEQISFNSFVLRTKNKQKIP